MGKYKLIMGLDNNRETYGYNIVDIEKDETVLHGDGYKDEDEIIIELSNLSEALRSIFG